MDKEIKSAFEIEDYTIESFEVSKGINAKLLTKITDINFWREYLGKLTR